MIKDAKRLYALGFAVHWLQPKSKRPLEKKWTTGERKPWAELEASYEHGFNMGVRLGQASRVGGGYLAVIDCDVKSADPAHVAEMEEKLRELVPDGRAPSVHSGRGNGSRHIYGITASPVRPYRFAQSPVKVEVHMPSATPSPYEQKTLSQAALARGMRLRAAWEISVMGEGQQVVLPPSLHPDTGHAYVWARAIRGAGDLPSFTFKRDFNDASRQVKQDFKAVEVDLVGSELPDRIVNMILSGEGVEDRSSALFICAMQMLRAGFTDNEVLSVLTDREIFLGQTAFEHAKTDSRKRAAEWVSKYTLGKARKEALAVEQFNEEVEEVALSEQEAERQATEIMAERDWRDLLERGSPQEGSKPKPSLKNINLVLRNAVGKDIFRKNLFSGTDTYGLKSPWNGARVGDEVQDIDVTNLIHWFVKFWGFEAPKDRVYQAIAHIASESPYHPVRDYLKGLEWDGVPRLDGWLKRYLNADGPDAYLSAVGRKVLVAMVARVLEPGKKFDQVLILEGDQGVGKSTAVRLLADPWFSDAHINISDKDAVVSMRSIWVMELGELSGMRKADVDQLKEFISRQVDRIRMPYGRLAENMPRQCIFIGTTNSTEYLRDATGNRRFWPVRVGGCDFEALKADRDQLLAEAQFAYELGEPLYLETRELQELAAKEQEGRVWHDEWVGVIGQFLERESETLNTREFTIAELLEEPNLFGMRNPGVSEQMRAASALRTLGYRNFRVRKGDARLVVWKPQKGHQRGGRGVAGYGQTGKSAGGEAGGADF